MWRRSSLGDGRHAIAIAIAIAIAAVAIAAVRRLRGGLEMTVWHIRIGSLHNEE